MKIAISGGNGFIGMNLIPYLENQKHEVIIIDSYIRQSFKHVNEYINEIPDFDYLIHLASKNYVPDSFEAPELFFSNNINVTLICLEITRIKNAKFIFISSYVYGSPEYLPIDENHRISPANPYSWSKLIGENLCESYFRDFGVPCLIIRPFNIYGNGQNNKFIIPTIIKQFKSGHIQLNDPRPKRDFLNIKDFQSAILSIINFDFNDFEIYNLGFGESFAIKDIIDILKPERPNVNVSFRNIYRKGEVLDTICNANKFRSKFKWEPKIDFRIELIDLFSKSSNFSNE
jgi:nucleoside-diphosphate-sugar epimerase